VQIVGRTRPDVSARQTQAELTVLSEQFQATSPEPIGDRTVAVTAEPARFFGGTGDLRFQASVAAVMVSVGLLLMVACTNVANLALAGRRPTSGRSAFAWRSGPARAGLFANW
jgi:hypothetical protein